MSCCAFGNSLTLPLVFLLALLPAAAADRATGYLALFMMGWSPMLWSFGLQLLGRSMPPTQPGVIFSCCFRPAVCAVQHWLATSLCFGALACSCLAGPCHQINEVRSPTVVLHRQPVLWSFGLQWLGRLCHQLNQVCSFCVVLGCALELWLATTWPPVHAIYCS